jgi:hypothetical protein
MDLNGHGIPEYPNEQKAHRPVDGEIEREVWL